MKPLPHSVRRTDLPEYVLEVRGVKIPNKGIQGFLALHEAGLIRIDPEQGTIERVLERALGFPEEWRPCTPRSIVHQGTQTRSLRCTIVVFGSTFNATAKSVIWAAAHPGETPIRANGIGFKDGDQSNIRIGNLERLWGKPAPKAPGFRLATMQTLLDICEEHPRRDSEEVQRAMNFLRKGVEWCKTKR